MSLYLSGGRRTVNTLPDPDGDRIRQLSFNASDAERGMAATRGAHDRAAAQALRDRDARMQRTMDPLAYMEHVNRRSNSQEHENRLLAAYPNMTQEAARRLIAEDAAGPMSGYTVGSRTDKVRSALHNPNSAGRREPIMMTPGAPAKPGLHPAQVGRTAAALDYERQNPSSVHAMIKDPITGFPVAPNPAFGDLHGLEWDGQKWVKKNPNQDLERQLMELELERRRKDMDNDSGDQGALLKSWLAKRLGG